MPERPGMLASWIRPRAETTNQVIASGNVCRSPLMGKPNLSLVITPLNFRVQGLIRQRHHRALLSPIPCHV